MGHLPRRPFRYTPPVYRDYCGHPAIFWRHRQHVEFIYQAEHPRWVAQKRLTKGHIAAELFRAAFDYEVTGWDWVRDELETWERFAKYDHAFQGAPA